MTVVGKAKARKRRFSSWNSGSDCISTTEYNFADPVSTLGGDPTTPGTAPDAELVAMFDLPLTAKRPSPQPHYFRRCSLCQARGERIPRGPTVASVGRSVTVARR